jgi:hypothetical protein
VKLIQAMKKLKDLKVKADDLREKVGKHCADLSIENPVYPDQKAQVAGWIQSHHDVVKEILSLRVAIQRTNLHTEVAIEIGGKHVTKSIAEWIHRRRDLATLDMTMWATLTDRTLREQNVQTVKDGPVTEIRIRRYFDVVERDAQHALYRSEPSVIDGVLEVTNATTDLIEV